VSQYLDKFSNDKYQLFDFRTHLKKESIMKLAGYFKEERNEEEIILMGYIMKILGKLMEVTSTEMINFLDEERDIMDGLVKNIGDSSVTQFLISLLSDNFIVKEKKTELKSEELVKSKSLEHSYGKGFDSRSKNKLFRDCSETIFDHQKIEILETLEKGKLLLLKDIIKEEIQDYQSKSNKGKTLLIEIFRDLLKLGRMDVSKTNNVVKVLFETLSKLLDLVCEEVGVKGVNTYMNRMNR
jgi:hypothetical protein